MQLIQESFAVKVETLRCAQSDPPVRHPWASVSEWRI